MLINAAISDNCSAIPWHHFVLAAAALFSVADKCLSFSDKHDKF
ncbi:hypothetical protein CPter291_1495 [Collimonas pratensis]|uniref:Uncharacterized protein n=1 Tax=Collimonas pratensis TaxID=279113 RepID=A0A127QUP8_9BURK|nr:hypothetical protein CPter91_1433 [Collimonas pratensis]AMP13768.1 hypothetical protein CPter291_1495 [Collimonas pratensis]